MEQAHALADSVRANQTFFVEGFMYLAHPLFCKLQDVLLDEGAVKRTPYVCVRRS